MCVSDPLLSSVFMSDNLYSRYSHYLQIIAHKIVHFQWNELPKSCQPREWKEFGVLECVACRVNFLLPRVDLRAHDALNAAQTHFLSYLKGFVMASAQVCLPQGGEPRRTSTHLQRDADFSSQGVPSLVLLNSRHFWAAVILSHLFERGYRSWISDN